MKLAEQLDHCSRAVPKRQHLGNARSARYGNVGQKRLSLADTFRAWELVFELIPNMSGDNKKERKLKRRRFSITPMERYVRQKAISICESEECPFPTISKIRKLGFASSSQNGRLGIVFTSCKFGNCLAILKGSQAPLILQKSESQTYYNLRQAYVRCHDGRVARRGLISLQNP
jgi:hypothetical protein